MKIIKIDITHRECKATKGRYRNFKLTTENVLSSNMCNKHKLSFPSRFACYWPSILINLPNPFNVRSARWKADPAQRDFNGKRIEEVPCTRTNKKYLRPCAGNTSGAREAAGDTRESSPSRPSKFRLRQLFRASGCSETTGI